MREKRVVLEGVSKKGTFIAPLFSPKICCHCALVCARVFRVTKYTDLSRCAFPVNYNFYNPVPPYLEDCVPLSVW